MRANLSLGFRSEKKIDTKFSKYPPSTKKRGKPIYAQMVPMNALEFMLVESGWLAEICDNTDLEFEYGVSEWTLELFTKECLRNIEVNEQEEVDENVMEWIAEYATLAQKHTIDWSKMYAYCEANGMLW